MTKYLSLYIRVHTLLKNSKNHDKKKKFKKSNQGNAIFF